MPSIGVIGATGRLGSRVVRAAAELDVKVTLEGSRSGWVGDAPDVLIDVSNASAFADVLGYCHRLGVPLLSATSGLTAGDRDRMLEVSRDVAVLRADNLSLGHHIQRGVVGRLQSTLQQLSAGKLGSVGIVDRHPVYKVDRPSATALALQDRMAAGATAPFPVSIDSVRAGMPVCEHDVRLTLADEEVVIQHAVRDWSAYSAMAVRAALWLVDRPAADLYTMDDFYSWLLSSSPH